MRREKNSAIRKRRKRSMSPTREGFYAVHESGKGTFATREDGDPLPEDFAETQAVAAGPDPRIPVAAPEWYLSAKHERLPAEAIVATLIERVPHETSLCQARLIIHELSRDPAGAEAVRRLFTPDTIGQIARRNGR
jgi:hypothetical protein